MEEKSKNGKLITFYSYKGGVGRTMSLVNIAAIMAMKNKNILLIDWDLEAPGLHDFFPNYNKSCLGLVDFVSNLSNAKDAELENLNTYFQSNIGNYIEKVKFENNNELSVDLMKAGKFDENYTNKLQVIDWIGLYQKSPSFFREFAQYLESLYDYILVDSRTGLSDTGGICTMLLPQILVTVFALNKQNINGVYDVAKQALEYRFESYDERELTVLPLPSRIDDQNTNEFSRWLELYTKKFESLFQDLYLLDECRLHNYFSKAKIPYKPPHSYGENIPVLKEDTGNDSFISFHYASFYKLIDYEGVIWDMLSDGELEQRKKEAFSLLQKGGSHYISQEYEQALDLFHQAIELDPSSYLAHAIMGETFSILANQKTGEEKDRLYELAFEKYGRAIEIKPDFHDAFYNWGNELINLAATKTGEERDRLCQLAFEKYSRAIEIKPDKHEAFNNWGNDLGGLASTKTGEERDRLYELAFEKYGRAIEIKPDFHEAFYNWGNDLGSLAGTKTGEERDRLYELAFEKYGRAIEIKPDKHEAFNNWGNHLGNLASTKTGEERDRLYELAFERYGHAIEIKPDKHEAFNNWGNHLGNLASTKTGKERDRLYELAFEKYGRAIEIKPDFHEAFNNWGNDLGSLAGTKTGEERDRLYELAFEKYGRAIEIKPDFHQAFNNWSSSLLRFYHIAKENDKNNILDEAYSLSKKLYELTGNSYNLACVYALKRDKNLALEYLQHSLAKNSISIEHIEEDKDWIYYKEDKDFINLLAKYRTQ